MDQEALHAREKALGKRHPNTLTSVSNLALTLQYQGKYEAAELMARPALDGCEKVLGKKHPDTLISTWYLASLLRRQRQYHDSIILYQRAYVATRKSLA